ncbi:MAG: sulfotransferase family 2 domain-containing protein [Limisphaerales bacterium]
MAVINRSMMIFLHIPKTAGSTFQFIIENSLGITACHTNHTKRPVFTQADLDFAQKTFPVLRSIAGHNLVDPLSLSAPNPFYLTFLREPVARVFSYYQESLLNGNPRTFEEDLRQNEFLENLHVKLMAGERNLDKAKRFLERCGFVGLTEKFELSLDVLARLSPYPLNMNYKKRRVAQDNRVKKSLESDSRLVEMTREYNKLDLELYSFAVNEIFPKLCAKAGLNPTDKVASHDHYTSDLKWKYLLCHFYNQSFYRQICKVRSKYFSPATPAAGVAGK